jgi:hypothetical protein
MHLELCDYKAATDQLAQYRKLKKGDYCLENKNKMAKDKNRV